MNNTANCLIRQFDCGLKSGQIECSKCGMRSDVRYVSKEDMDMAVAKGTALYWQNHASSLQILLNDLRPSKRISLGQLLRARLDLNHVVQDHPEAPEMVTLPSGSYLMGSASDDEVGSRVENPQHQVTVGYRLALGRYAVTFEEWDACVADGGVNYKPKDQGWGRGKRPVINVSWDDVQEYVAWLNQKLGISQDDPSRYRLPSEAEWEYACRAGTTGNFSTPTGQISDCDATYNASITIIYSTLSSKAGKKHDRTTQVGIYAPNPWGLYDMHGNVSEWVYDSYEDSYRGAPADGRAREAGAGRRVVRGGNWSNSARDLRSAARDHFEPGARGIMGFRLAKTLP